MEIGKKDNGGSEVVQFRMGSSIDDIVKTIWLGNGYKRNAGRIANGYKKETDLVVGQLVKHWGEIVMKDHMGSS